MYPALGGDEYIDEGASEYEVGIDEKLGNVVPLDTELLDENGNEVTLGDMVNGKPTILAFVYYTCPGICSPLLNGLGEVVDRVRLEPAEEFQVVTISFDPEDTPALAAAKKKNYFNALEHRKGTFPQEGWRWMTGSQENVKKLTEATGFNYKPDNGEYLHAATLIAISPEGKIARYLYGTKFLPFDLKMALLEAAEGRTGPTITKALLYCFSYDPAGRTYTLNILRVVGTTITITLMSFFAFLVWGGRKASYESKIPKEHEIGTENSGHNATGHSSAN